MWYLWVLVLEKLREYFVLPEHILLYNLNISFGFLQQRNLIQQKLSQSHRSPRF